MLLVILTIAIFNEIIEIVAIPNTVHRYNIDLELFGWLVNQVDTHVLCFQKVNHSAPHSTTTTRLSFKICSNSVFVITKKC